MYWQRRTNRFKDKIKKGQLAFEVMVDIPYPPVVEILAEAGYDSIFLDMEHTSFGLETFQDMMIAADEYGITSTVRVPENDPIIIHRALDAGALGIIIPHIRNKEDALRAVKATKYPPEGIRGWPGGHIRANRYKSGIFTFGQGVYTAEFVKRSNELVHNVLLIEDVEAFEKIDEILSVPGIDLIYPGMGDLSVNVGFDRAYIQNAYDKLYRRCKEKGIGLHLEASEVNKWYPGCYFLTGVDCYFLGDAASAKLEEIRRTVQKP